MCTNHPSNSQRKFGSEVERGEIRLSQAQAPSGQPATEKSMPPVWDLVASSTGYFGVFSQHFSQPEPSNVWSLKLYNKSCIPDGYGSSVIAIFFPQDQSLQSARQLIPNRSGFS